MARIRTVKPGFFRHEELQALEVENPGCYIMLVFQGLWILADSKGRFLYKPKTMKLDILPFIPFEIESTLKVLEMNNFIKVYEVDGTKYGKIPSFNEHQRITGKEKIEGEKYPDPTDEQRGNTRETPGKHPVAQEGKGRERKGEGEIPRTMESFKIEDCKLIGSERLVYETSKVLYDRFKEKFPNNKDLPLIPMLNWIAPVRSLVKKEYTREQIFAVAKWAVNDKFWKKTILTAEALEKHFERLKLEYQDAGKTTD